MKACSTVTDSGSATDIVRHVAFGAILLQVTWGTASAAPPADARCEQQTQPQVMEAIAEANKLLDGMWLVLGDNRYTTFRKASERSNPFDLQAKQGPSTLEGYIWVAGAQLQSDQC